MRYNKNRRNQLKYLQVFHHHRTETEMTTPSCPNPRLTLQSLPKPLQQKYKNSIVFQCQNRRSGQSNSKKFQFDPAKIKKRKIDKQKTIQQKLDQFDINHTELKHLYNVFDIIGKKKSSFGYEEVLEVLRNMGMQMLKADIQQMIWQFDQDLDKHITISQFIKMYKRCMMDKAAAQPKKLFHLTQFLMYCKPGHFRITVQDTLQLLYVRALQEAEKNKLIVKDLFEDSIKVIFGDDYQSDNGVETQISFQEYLEKINKKAIEKRKKEIEKIKSQLRYS